MNLARQRSVTTKENQYMQGPPPIEIVPVFCFLPKEGSKMQINNCETTQRSIEALPEPYESSNPFRHLRNHP